MIKMFKNYQIVIDQFQTLGSNSVERINTSSAVMVNPCAAEKFGKYHKPYVLCGFGHDLTSKCAMTQKKLVTTALVDSIQPRTPLIRPNHPFNKPSTNLTISCSVTSLIQSTNFVASK